MLQGNTVAVPLDRTCLSVRPFALFGHGQLTAQTQTLLWAVGFFLASAAASA
jgi:hypothetical protein